MAIRSLTAEITISDLKDGESVNTSNCELAINANQYSTAQDIDLELKFLDYGFIGTIKPVDGKVKFRFKSTGFIPINGILKYGYNNVQKIRVELNSTYDLEVDFKSNNEQVIYMYGNMALHLLSGTLTDVQQWGTAATVNGVSTLGSTVFVGGEKILKNFPKIIWSALDEPDFQYITNMDEFCLDSNLNIDMSNWNVSRVASHVNFTNETNESILPTFEVI